jgi:hypothetical protein
MLEKNILTFDTLNIIMKQQQYRERNFKRYLGLILCLFMTEPNNELLIKKKIINYIQQVLNHFLK